MERKMTYKLSCRLFTDAKCFGPGVAQLLHAVQQLRSLRAAALSMDMAYSKAWIIVKNSEKALGFPLLTSTTGGKGGGGAALTPRCVQLLDAYDSFCKRLQNAAVALRSLYCMRKMSAFPLTVSSFQTAGASGLLVTSLRS